MLNVEGLSIFINRYFKEIDIRRNNSMKFELTPEGNLTATVKGRITRLEKRYEYTRDDWGRKSSTDTCLYVHITAYDTPEYVFEGTTYRTPKRFVLECYAAVRGAIGVKVHGKLAITDEKMLELRALCVNKEVSIFMGIPKETIPKETIPIDLGDLGDLFNGLLGSKDLYASVALGDFCVDNKPLFHGKVRLEQVD